MLIQSSFKHRLYLVLIEMFTSDTGSDSLLDRENYAEPETANIKSRWHLACCVGIVKGTG